MVLLQFVPIMVMGRECVIPLLFAVLQFTECIDEHKLKRGMKIEVVDKMCVSAMRVAIIEAIVGGRLRLTYADSKVYRKNKFEDQYKVCSGKCE